MKYSKQWKRLEDVLSKTYHEHGLQGRFTHDKDYLKYAFERTEEMWEENNAKVHDVRLVMLSEAPLFGDAETYFYNPSTKFTSFFHFNDAEAILGKDFSKDIRFIGYNKKTVLHEMLAEAGFVVLDLFPFALNEKKTGLTYRRLPAVEYDNLFNDLCDLYFLPKLVRLTNGKVPWFIFRYKRLRDNVGARVAKELAEMGKDKATIIESIHGTNMSLSREKLGQIWSQVNESADRV